ncbi:MAG TPA: maleylpyruvate isomerase family mycothiol-dependent enzyme [Acidimicrobiia bacterium]|jgi:uncharacterized protein (TIGR03083 family)|nr:maleylpyruvate isomerase family mycothiol-dependent enzyme [Acidimicrobiia bacterium]
MDATELLGHTRDALAGATENLAELIAAVPDPMVLAHNSLWTVQEVAAHLIVGGGVYADIARGVPAPYQSVEPAYLHAEFTKGNAEIAETDPAKLSRLFVDAMGGFLDAISDIPGDTPVIMHGQNPFTVAGAAGVLLGELLLHGYDVATAIGRPWPIDPAATQLVLAAYPPALGFLLNPETTRGLSAGFGIELRGVGEMTVRFTDGVYSLEEPGAAVDATISADPVAFLMVGTGRLSRYEAIALGLMNVGGNRPDLAIGFQDLFLFP